MEYSVKQIAELRGVSEQAIYKQLKTHRKALAGHITKRDGKNWYDEEAVRLLEKFSSTAAPVIVENENKGKVEELERKIKELQEQHERDQERINDALSVITGMIKENNQNAKLVAESKLYIEQRDNFEKKSKELQDELEKFQKGLFGLYRKKD